jgi:hypothetical protein
MPGFGEKLFMLVLSHLLSALFDDAAQSITSPLRRFAKEGIF